MGSILLAGGAEFTGKMAEPDTRAIELAGGFNAPVVIIPTAAAPDNNHQRAGRNGERWFHSLGASQVEVLPLIDSSSANDSGLANQIRQARLVYLLGGFPGYLGRTLAQSLCWQAILSTYEQGAVLAGSSAGAMVLCQYYFDPQTDTVVDGLGLLPNSCVLPHYNTFGKHWVSRLAQVLPTTFLIGIDEQTGLLDDRETQGGHKGWTVYGWGNVTLFQHSQPITYAAGEAFSGALFPLN